MDMLETILTLKRLKKASWKKEKDGRIILKFDHT
jgi:hypothetical protein